MMKYFYAALCAAVFMLSAPVMAAETPVSVSVLSHDAKFIGTSMAGADIIIRDAVTDEILAQGVTAGTTGDTDLIMADQRGRDEIIRSANSARFDATLDLDRPKRVVIQAIGPNAQPQSRRIISAERVLIPGRDYASGNGIILVMPGMSVDILSPAAHSKRDFDPDGDLTITVNAMKLCGCPIRETGPWPADRYTVTAHIYDGDGDVVKNVTLDYAGADSRFSGDIQLTSPGVYDIYVTAFDPKTKDSGMDRTSIILQ
jgi:hypothetical protein